MPRNIRKPHSLHRSQRGIAATKNEPRDSEKGLLGRVLARNEYIVIQSGIAI
jgi:hypothetical protein